MASWAVFGKTGDRKSLLRAAEAMRRYECLARLDLMPGGKLCQAPECRRGSGIRQAAIALQAGQRVVLLPTTTPLRSYLRSEPRA
jgi:hypothetical protein